MQEENRSASKKCGAAWNRCFSADDRVTSESDASSVILSVLKQLLYDVEGGAKVKL